MPRAFLGRHDRCRAEKEAEVAILRSQAALVSASNKAKGMVAEAEAEMKAVEGLAEKRRFELEWKRLEVRAPPRRPHVAAGSFATLVCYRLLLRARL